MHPFGFFTDGGTYNDDTKYFINNIFSTSGVCYSTKVPVNANLQFYIGRSIDSDPLKMLPKDHKIKGQANQILLPYEKHFKDPEEEETFKLLGELEIRNMGSGYTCFVKSYMFCISSDRDIKISKSYILQFFENINTVEKFEALKLPIKKVSRCSDGTLNVAYEIDLSQKSQLYEVFKTKKLDCLPVLWVFSTPSYTKWSVKFEQRIACKYFALKLIDSVKGSTYDNNIDMYNLTLTGHTMKLPSINNSLQSS